eukprot:g18392.t1
MDQNLTTTDRNVAIMDQNLRRIDWNVPPMDQNLRTMDGNITTMDRSLSKGLYYLSRSEATLPTRIEGALMIIQAGYYPILAIVRVP